MNRTALIERVKTLAGLTDVERADLLTLLTDEKTYGLTWENKSEQVEEDLRANLPVLREIPDRRIWARKKNKEVSAVISEVPSGQLSLNLTNHTQAVSLLESLDEVHQGCTSSNDSNKEKSTSSAPHHLLIEGDNLHALTVLNYTHAGRVDVIYIDPPYNTGNKDFKYNDRFVDREDSYRHSKWLSFMHKRLTLARTLLKPEGVIFISIDDNEQAQLKLLCDSVFGEANFVATIIWKKKTNGNNMGHIPPVHDFIISYAKSIENLSLPGVLVDDETINKTYKNPDNDKRGPWTVSDLSANHVGPFFKIINPLTLQEHWPPKGRYWVFNEVEVNKRIEDGRIIFGKSGEGKPVQKVFLRACLGIEKNW